MAEEKKALADEELEKVTGGRWRPDDWGETKIEKEPVYDYGGEPEELPPEIIQKLKDYGMLPR